MIKPFKFQSLLEPKIWGGSNIAVLKGLTSAPENVGESLELSALVGEETPVVGGEDDGSYLSELINKYGARLVGRSNFERFGEKFPLLFKIIDAAEALSIQVHPDDEMAQREGMPYGKSEMWYIIRTMPGSSLINGFSRDITPEEYEQMIEDGTFDDCLNHYETHVGDCFYIPAGRIHSIGAGNMLIEVQQSSGATYRVYDFKRRDKNGNERELHIEKAREALNFHASKDGKESYSSAVGKAVLLKQSPFFTSHVFHLDEPFCQNYKDIDSFVVIIAYEGSARMTDGSGNEIILRTGETVMFPAENDSISFVPLGNSRFSCFETYVQ